MTLLLIAGIGIGMGIGVRQFVATGGGIAPPAGDPLLDGVSANLTDAVLSNLEDGS